VTARTYVHEAVEACEIFGDGPIVDALRLAPGALLATVLSPTSR
jgi:hypothetical protein